MTTLLRRIRFFLVVASFAAGLWAVGAYARIRQEADRGFYPPLDPSLSHRLFSQRPPAN